MMSSAFLLLSLLGICLATPLEFEPLSDAQISYINKVQSSWKAGRNFGPNDLERVKNLLSVNKNLRKRQRKVNTFPASDVEIVDALPKNFDARQKWPQCKSINEIRDQSACGSGWAVAPAAAMTDRMCIHNNKTVRFSAEDILACCGYCGTCYDGDPEATWDYYVKQGVVTGGSYNSNEGCMPYSFPQCEHDGSTGKYKPCPHKAYPTPSCKQECRKGYGKTYKEDKYFGQGVQEFDTVKQIKHEIVNNGPVTTEFDIYEDFFSYKSGIYKHTTGELLGSQVAKIIGYGVEDGQKYWLATNSWNEDWGDKGLFKIAFDNCGFEDNVYAVKPKAKLSVY